jgi:two-component system sensor histidine kinase QseC
VTVPDVRPAPSLRVRLLLTLLGTAGVLWISAAALIYRDAQRELAALLDAHLAQSASLLAAQSAHELEELHFDLTEAFAPYRQHVVFQVWDADGRLLLKSADAPAVRLSATERGLSDASSGATRWRVYSDWDREQRFLVQVAEDQALRDRIAARIAWQTTLPLLLGLPLLAAALVWAVSRALRPVVALGREVQQRRASTLAPIPADDVPREIRPLIESLNALLGRVRHAVEQERRFTANAAHELRTPLAALRVQAELAQSAGDAASSALALRQVIAACDRLTRLVAQLLMLARVDEDAGSRAPCRLDVLAREIIAEAAPRALAAQQEIALDAPGAIGIEGHGALLAVLLRNLLDNALRHGGTPLQVELALRHEGAQVSIDVRDDGRGIAADALGQLGERFYRPDDTQAEGSGLGLALVRRIAEWHGGTLQLATGPGGRGFRATVILPVGGSAPGAAGANVDS